MRDSMSEDGNDGIYHERVSEMTNLEYERLKESLKNNPDREKVLAAIKQQHPCIGCSCNDGLPHSRCYGCDD